MTTLRNELERELEAEGIQALASLEQAARLPYFTERFLRSNAIPKRKIRGRLFFAREDIIEFLVNRSRIQSA